MGRSGERVLMLMLIVVALGLAVAALVLSIGLQPGRTGKRGQSGRPGADGRDGANGADGAPGRAGSAGPTGDPSDPPANRQTISFGMMLAVPPTYSFAFSPMNSAFLPPQWNPTSTTAAPPTYVTTFLVPHNGVIDDLNVRADVQSDSLPLNPQFDFAVYVAHAPANETGPGGPWTPGGLTATIPPVFVPGGESSTAVANSATGSAPVFEGSLLTVVISPSGYNQFDLQPALFAASLSYTPLNFG